MKIAIIGMGLIGGSFYKAFLKAEQEVAGFDRDDPVDVKEADIVIVATHPRTAIEVITAHAGEFKDGAIVVDTCGIKKPIMEAVAPLAKGARWRFCGGHPMAGKEYSGFRNSDPALFSGASMILVPGEGIDDEALALLEDLFRQVGFKRMVLAEAARHDEMIAYTSQLCHIVSSAFLRDELAPSHEGFSAGSFRDMIRVGAPDPYLWSELFLDNSAALMPVLNRFIGRLTAMRDAIAANDRDAIWTQLSEGRPIKAQLASGSGKGHWTSAMKRKEPRTAATLPKSADGGEEWVVPS